MDLVHVEREKESLGSELSARKQELETTKQLMENQRAEERKLRKIISEASAERTRQKKELEQVCGTMINYLSCILVITPSVLYNSGHQ